MATQNINESSSMNDEALAEYAKVFNINVSQVLDHLSASSSIGAYGTAIGGNYWGFNHRNTAAPIPINRDGNGMVFFTRPDLNLASSNIRHYRAMNPLQTNSSLSLPRIFRSYLDPDLAKSKEGIAPIDCPLVDNLQAFIPLLTNSCQSASGFEDLEAPMATTKPGAYGEAMSFVDGHSDKLGVYDITTSFRNTVGDPIMMLMYYWIRYATAVRQGILVPKFKNVFENRVDSQTRIYRLVLDHSRTYVQKIACTGASIPKFTPMGASMNFEAEKPFNAANDQVSITWSGHGLYYMDDFIVRSFNSAVKMFNPGMREIATKLEGNNNPSAFSRANAPNYVYSSARYTKIPISDLTLFNNRGYPYIIPETMELSWWVDSDDYRRVMSGMTLTPNGTGF